MKFISGSAFLSLASLVSLVAAWPRRGPTTPAGAIFFATNEASSNTLISATVQQNGTLTFGGAYSTGGNGEKGFTVPDTAVPDGLFSGDSVFVNPTKSLVAVVNAGSNTVSMFSINSKNQTQLTQIGKPVSSGGDFPNSVTINKAATQAYVLNTGTKNGVQGFTVDPKRGFISQPGSFRSLGLVENNPPGADIRNPPGSDLTVGGPGTASDVFLSHDESKLVVSVKGIFPSIGYVAIWDVLPGGQLSANFTQISAPNNGSGPFGATPIKGKNAFLIADSNVGADIFDLDTGKSFRVPVPGQFITCWAVYSPKTGNYYLSDPGTTSITEVSINSNLTGGAVVNQYILADNSLPVDMTVVSAPNNDYLYVLSGGIASVQSLALNAPGKATIGPILNLTAVAPTVPAGFLLQGIAHITP